jgi:formylglycine-generating enzyme required for sulfatase activity
MEFWSKFKQGLEVLCQAEGYLPTCHAPVLDEAIASDLTLAMLVQRLWLLQLKLRALEDGDDTLSDDTDADLEAKLNPECQHKLLEFKQLLANKMQTSEIDSSQPEQFLQWRRSRQKDLQQKLQTTERQIILAIRASDRHTALEQLKAQLNTSTSSAKLAARATAKSRIWEAIEQNLHLSDAFDLEMSRFSIVPVQVLLHIPPSSETDVNDLVLFPELTARLEKLCQIYREQDRSVDLLAGNWFSEAFSGKSAVADLFTMLKTEPIVVLESDVFAGILYLHLGYWGLSCAEYRYVPGVLEIDLRQCLNSLAKHSALEWWKGLKQATAQGIPPEQYSQNYDPTSIPIFIENLKAIEQEQNARQSGIDIDTSEMSYTFCQSDLDRLQQYIASSYCISIGLQLDEYFLLNPIPKLRLKPLLPKFLSQLLKDIPSQETSELVKLIVMRYQSLYQGLREQEPLAYPDLCLELGLSLSHLPDKSWAQGQIVQSMNAWLDLRNIKPLPPHQDRTFNDLINTTIANTTLEDWDYLNQINQCLTAIGYDRKVSFADSYFERGKLKYYAEDYQDAISNFSQAIALDDSYVEAHLHRGLAYTSLGKYQVAIDDYSRALELQPDLAKAYNYRGNTYRELGNCQAAIADYDRALALDPNLTSANSDRQITLDIMAEAERHQPADRRTESGYSREFEYEVVRLNSNGKEINRRINRAKLLIQDITSSPELSATLEMVYIPNGVCFMGSSDREAGRELNESPQHWVNVARFFMGKYPVTQSQWQVVANLPPSNPAKPLVLNPDPSEFKGSDRPVESISWFEVMEFCARLSRATGRDYRLPSEAEWEYACRGGTKTPFCYGHTISTDLANYDGTSGYGFGSLGEYRTQTLAVNSFPVCNPFGLADMHGQVWEWCADPWHDNYQGAPNNESIWEEDGDDEYRVVRGGSWFVIPGRCRAAARSKYTPDVWLNQIGFRLALSI